ncbi:MAG: serine/threonine protein kinase [Labilithrix sp.]|nr:serine/threonine protein kinase [Labilithrix sp.]MCW5817241.1 serine/threonine protein kinase [Labilithrix sp.]
MASSPQLSETVGEGQVLAGKYRIDRKLGAGGMCIVYEAEHIHLKQAIAIKVLKPDFAKDPTAVARFAQEAQSAAGLRSPNVARVYDVDLLPDGQPYITMELLVGNDLGTELQRRYSLPMELAVDYVRQAAIGIAEAHAMGIVHRDLKPENLFLSELGEMTERRLVKILDFGIAKNVQETSRKLTAPDAVFGTVDYMSPEQIRSASTVDHRTDIWSLGVILFELLTGRTPYVGDARSVIAQIVSDPIVPPSRYVPTLPAGLVAVVMKALAKDPAQRYQNAQDLRAALTPFTEGVESITGILARIPPTSIPRRKPIDPISSVSVRMVRETGRDVKGTNLSFESGVIGKVWNKNITVFAVALAMMLGIVLLIGMTRRKKPPPVTVTAVEAPIQNPAAQPAQPALPPMPVVLTAPAPVLTAAPTDTTPTPIAVAPASAAPPAEKPDKPEKPEKHEKPKKPPPPRTGPKPAPAPAPAPPPTTNPKLL